MDVRQLRCFIAVAEELHFGRAAERLGIAPPALSRQISTLEDELGVALLTRTTRQVAMTRAGLIMLEEAKGILVKMEHASRAVREASLSSGKVLRVGAIDAASSSFVPEALMAFRARFPGIEIKFVEAITTALIQMLEAGKLDMALTRPPRKPTDCAFEILRVERPVVVLNENHPLAAREHLTMLDLVGEPFVVPSKRLRPYAYDLVMAYFESVGAVPNVTIEATEKPAMMSAVAAGLGMALAPDWVSRLSFPGVTMRRLRGAMLDPPPPGALIGVSWRPQQKLPSRDDFLAILRDSVTLLDERHILPFALPKTQKRTARTGSPVGGA
ncbi:MULTISPECIES: LysR family transcriptional regulator [Bosea]|uniref:LysR family transcriptional regulator n=1 Tax=Bosea TaxID=85413 RepID=UPI0021500F0F|nr:MULTISPECIES: LysR substrate-binding domain-containing protein [Bosea]MCR4521363.1 LysR substrate-binding domain-containing protein [Bosea sp. 47.2.35]MDR6826788.1 DNA-binding transcriptional LysR family regulator [Bosea robiniae]MDR6893498.1 DNA-binding transcriptional LysR family regulator [Bosea sp. BE109]MDR7136803.1 DNA-binding transcriptional LysR family regulator [Bosea sp. BE168]MDR7173502.1 DNA-binding transcriptional LysR family regulator [Bosea sp. BE271]